MAKASSNEKGRDSWVWVDGRVDSTAGPLEGADGPPDDKNTASKLSPVPERADAVIDGAGGKAVLNAELPFVAEAVCSLAEVDAAVAAAKSKLSSKAESNVNCEGGPLLLGALPNVSSKAATSAGGLDTEGRPFLDGVSVWAVGKSCCGAPNGESNASFECELRAGDSLRRGACNAR